ncbi:hypothetical protein [Streptomyces melanogenes]|uniref:hypothetical protein n=1 Tax=Streptomyces melanogenes TaxID=67326 RepID=UPI00167C8D8D|nr:hypothetical protein [Streptomyces melanogenes]
MKRIDSKFFEGVPQNFVAQIDLEVESLEQEWGESEITCDDLAEWVTFAFLLSDGTKVALVREANYPPHSGFILTAIGDLHPAEVLSRFLSEARIDPQSVLHRGFD